MDVPSLLLAALAVALVVAAWEARRLGNDRRDVTLLAMGAGLLGTSAAAVAAI